MFLSLFLLGAFVLPGLMIIKHIISTCFDVSIIDRVFSFLHNSSFFLSFRFAVFFQLNIPTPSNTLQFSLALWPSIGLHPQRTENGRARELKARPHPKTEEKCFKLCNSSMGNSCLKFECFVHYTYQQSYKCFNCLTP